MEVSENEYYKEYYIAVGIIADIRSGKRLTAKALKKIHPEWNESYCRAVISLARLLKKKGKHNKNTTISNQTSNRR